MTNLIGIYDHSTGENVIREMTIEEQKIRDAEIANNLAAKAEAEAQAATKAEAKAALLERLGISQAEADLLLS